MSGQIRPKYEGAKLVVAVSYQPYPAEKDRFYDAVDRAGLQDTELMVESAFIENERQLEILMGD